MRCCGTGVEESVVVDKQQQQQQREEESAAAAAISKNNKEESRLLLATAPPSAEKRPSSSAGKTTNRDERQERQVATDSASALVPGERNRSSTILSKKDNIVQNNHNLNKSRSSNANSMAMASPTTSAVAASQQQHSYSSSARDSSRNLGSALKEAWSVLVADNPDAAEQKELQRAIELSLLDCALVVRSGGGSSSSNSVDSQSMVHGVRMKETPPHAVLGVPPDATAVQIKSAYRKLVLRLHPDKPGGDPHEFARVAAAYRSLLASSNHRRTSSSSDGVSVSVATTTTTTTTAPGAPKQLKSTAHWDAEIKSHWDLVNELFANQDTGVAGVAARQQTARTALGLRPREAGASKRNERNERIRNSCFYLSLAVSYLNGIGALMCPPFDDERRTTATTTTTTTTTTTKTTTTGKMMKGGVGDGEQEMLRATDDALISHTALQLKRTIEAAVIQAHPEWARAGFVGEEVQAFSDFLVYTLEKSDTILADWAVAIFDETSGFVDVYKGRDYGGGDKGGGGAEEEDDWSLRSNTLTLRFVPGHYQPLLPIRTRPSLDEILATLDKESVFYVVTDGSA